MGVELTQWTVIRARGATGQSDDALGVMRLRSPTGELRPFSLARLRPEQRRELRELASGSKVTAELMRALLQDEGTTPARQRPYPQHPVSRR
jgi:hypothetical protein